MMWMFNNSFSYLMPLLRLITIIIIRIMVSIRVAVVVVVVVNFFCIYYF